jgi:hypothetical protein
MVKTGKAWAAIRKERVVSLISMSIPADCDFESFRSKAVEALAILGEVKSGEVVVEGGKFQFVQRLNHSNRSKKPREPKVYEI